MKCKLTPYVWQDEDRVYVYDVFVCVGRGGCEAKLPLSRSEPKRATLLSFQSYSLGFTKPDSAIL